MKIYYTILFFSLTSLSVFGQSQLGNWKYNVNEYTNEKSITTVATRESDSRFTTRVIIRSWKDGTDTWELLDNDSDYKELSTEDLYRVKYVNIYVKIGGVNQDFPLPYGRINYITPELKAALLKGTDATIKFNGMPHYHKFSLKGITAAFKMIEIK